MINDEQLLQAYARERSESAFGELVTRHLDCVYSAALRVVNGDTPLAQDVTQTVFIDLARQAGKLSCDVALAGWLHRHTCYTAAKAVRTERRRQSREHTAMEMRALDDNTRPEWEQVAPYLDESLNELNPKDRDALVLRFLRQQDLRAVGAVLGISEDAAQKRVDRALEKLHVVLKQRGATLSLAALGTALATQVVTAAPAGFAASVAATALASAAAASGGAMAFATAALRQMLCSNRRLVLGCGAAAVVTLVLLKMLVLTPAPGQAPQAVAANTDSPTQTPLAETVPSNERMGSFSAASFAGGIAPTLQIEGTLNMIDASGKETVWTGFTVRVSGVKYRVSNRYFNGELLVSGSNGTNSSFVNTMANVTTNRWEWGKVSEGQFPSKDLTPGQLCWLAFASAHYFVPNTPVTVPLEAFQENAEFHRCDVTLSPNQPNLPLRIKWYGSNYWHSAGDSGRPLAYTNEYLAGTYTVTATTNYQSAELPIRFNLEIFIPSFTGTDHGSEDVTLAQTLQGHVDSITPAEDIDDFRPELGARAQILDFRFPAGTNGALRGMTRLNRTWPEPNAPGQH